MNKHGSKIQMKSHNYKTGIVRHFTRRFSSHEKSAPDAGGKAKNSRGYSGINLPQPCFDGTIRWNTPAGLITGQFKGEAGFVILKTQIALDSVSLSSLLVIC